MQAETVGEKGWVEDFALVKAACAELHGQLDHRFLNTIEGLERPTLERMAEWILNALSPSLPAISSVEVARPSLNERVVYRR